LIGLFFAVLNFERQAEMIGRIMINNTVQVRIITIVSIILLFFTAGLLYMKTSFDAHINQIIEGEAAHQSRVLNRVIEFQKASLNSYVFDYTYWDDMVTIVEKRNTDLAALNIDPSMQSYNIQAVWVYDTSFSPIYFTNQDSGYLISKDINSCFNLRKVVTDTTFKHFYYAFEHVLIEFSIAPIQPSIDLTRIMPARGYFIAARFWDTSYLDQLSRITDSYIKTNNSTHKGSAFLFEKQSGSIIIDIPLCSWNGDTISFLESTDQKDFIRYFVRSANSLFILAVIAIIFIFGVVTILITSWFGRPLSRISKSLKDQDTILIDKLRNENNEFGRIAAMLSESFKQKMALQDEIIMRISVEDALKESEAKLRSIIETSPVIFWSMSIDFSNIYFVSHAAETMTGYGFSEIEAAFKKWMKAILTPETYTQFQGHLSELLSTKKSCGFECQFTHKNGSVRNASIILTPAINKNNEVYRIDGLAIDITERVALINKILQSEKMASVGLLAAGVAHEFNNLLCAIRGNIELLNGHCLLCNSCNENIKDATNACDRTGTLVESLLSFSRSDTEGQSDVDISHIIKSTIKLIEKEITRSGIDLIIDLKEIPIIRGIPGQIQQVIFNIMRNAIQAVSHNGQISIVAFHDDKNIFVQITDRGPGIEPQNIEKIFDPFFSTKGAWGKDKIPGTGLGLSISRNIIRNHQGDITVKSSVEKGTAFTISLPITIPHSLNAQTESSINGTAILLYEFDLLQANKFNEIIASAGGKTTISIWSDEAADLLSQNHYDCIIIDLGNPAMGDMVKLFDLLSAKYPNLPILIFGEIVIKYQYMEYIKIAKTILTKPILPATLIEAIQDCRNPNRTDVIPPAKINS
jgi:PAS domain S-box-containing protein